MITNTLPPWLQKVTTLLLWGLTFYLAGLASLKFDDPDSSIALMWFPAGVAVAAFLSARWRDYLALLVLFTLTTVLLDAQWHSSEGLALSVGYAFLSMPASVIIAWIVRRFARLNDDLHVILLWIVATLIISALDALVVGGGYALLHGQPLLSTVWRGFIADVTGIVFATTIVMGFINKRGPRLATHRMARISGLALWLVLCAITAFIFGLPPSGLTADTAALYFGLACLPVALVMILAMLWGNRGGSVALLTLGSIVIYDTDRHQGPFFIHAFGSAESLLLALSYLSATALLVVFIRVIRRSTSSFDPDTGRLAGQGVFYRLDPASGMLHWEGELSTLLGPVEPELWKRAEQVLQRVHPQDRDPLYAHWFASPGHKRVPLLFRIQVPEGEWVTLVDSGGIHITQNEEDAIVGNWQASHYHLAL